MTISDTKPMLSRGRGRQPAPKVVDVLKLKLESPSQAVKYFELINSPAIVNCDVLIVGGGVGGIAAALQATQSGLKVCLTEETDWLGGQMTSQGVSALDENYLVETSGSSLKYQQLRHAIRRHYQTQFTLRAEVGDARYLNPGNCWVSWLSFEPIVGLEQINRLLEPAVASGLLTIYQRSKAIDARCHRGRITAVSLVNLDSGHLVEFNPQICLDATELGDLLPLVRLEYRTGVEARETTGEPHAPESADPENVQDFVYPFAVEFRPGTSNVIAKPPYYDQFTAEGKFSFQGYRMFERSMRVEADGKKIELLPFWEYRRLIDRSLWLDSPCDFDLSMINWDSNDLRGENIIDKPPEQYAARLARAKALSLGFLYWLQTEAPRDDGDRGYPELRLRYDVMGTDDGLSKHPYIRESRRIVAQKTIAEQEIASATNGGARAMPFDDSVGIGLYPIDIHGRQEVPGAAQASKPFQLPLGALIPKDCKNLIAAAKNIGTTHITNGAYRLHPVEWSIGEAAGALACFCIARGQSPVRVWKNKSLLRQFQHELLRQGIPIHWYDDVPVWHPAFPAIQFLAISGIMAGPADNLHFRPGDPVSIGDAAPVLSRLLRSPSSSSPGGYPWVARQRLAPSPLVEVERSIKLCIKRRLLNLPVNHSLRPETPLRPADLTEIEQSSQGLGTPAATEDGYISRAHFAMWIYELIYKRI